MKHIALALLAMLLASGVQATKPAPVVEYDWQGVERVVAIGDVHGAYGRLLEILVAAKLIDGEEKWVGGAAHLVSLGDLLDRGPDSKAAIELLMRLQPEAVAAGGRVHVVLGNHELMNLTGDLRDVSDAELAAVGGLAGHQQAFSPSGTIGRWLLQQPIVIRVNDSVFAHGGFSPVAMHEINVINQRFHSSLSGLLTNGARLRKLALLPASGDLLEQSQSVQLLATAPSADVDLFVNAGKDPFFGPDGPLWYRGNAACHALLEADTVERLTDHFSVERFVVGHTPTTTREIESRLQGQVVMLDTGMLAAVYRGNPRALELTYVTDARVAPVMSVITTNGEVRHIDVHEERASKQLAMLSDAQDQSQVIFAPMKARAAKKVEASYRLSEHLGFGFVSASKALLDHHGESGVLQVRERLTLERERRERSRSRPNYCFKGSDFPLLAVFDALIGKKDRGLDNLAYDKRNWSIRTLTNETGFSTSKELPRYEVEPKLLPAMRARLEGLDQSVLDSLLGGLLKSREIKAILKRRNAILRWQT